MKGKTIRYQGKNINLDELSSQIRQQMESSGFKVQSKSIPEGNLIQAQKAGFLRDIITADRAFNIVINGTPDDFTIQIGIGKLYQNLAVLAIEAIVVSELFLAVDIPEMLWTEHVEKGIINQINTLVG